MITLKGRYKIILTTEKDAVRLANNPYFRIGSSKDIFYQPIEVEFLNYEEDFDETLIKLLTNIK